MRALVFGLVLCVAAWPVRAQDSDVQNQYELEFAPYHRITDKLIGNARLELDYNPEAGYTAYKVDWPGLTYVVSERLQLWAGLLSTYTDTQEGANTLQLRPWAGVKLFVPNRAKLHLYNYTRFEYPVTENLDTYQWTDNPRLRSRFGVEVPLCSRARAWKPNTWYALTSIEPFYEFDDGDIDPVLVRGGIGYIANDRLQMEFTYTAEFSRQTTGSSLEYNGNVFRLKIKLAIEKGILERLLNPENGD